MGWLGVENMQIPNPVFISGTIRAKGSVLEKKETRKQDRGLLTTRYEIFNQNDDLVMAYDLIFWS